MGSNRVNFSEETARRVACRYLDLDPELPSEVIEKLFSDALGQMMVDDVASAFRDIARLVLDDLTSRKNKLNKAHGTDPSTDAVWQRAVRETRERWEKRPAENQTASPPVTKDPA
jgi:hypothetical protein